MPAIQPISASIPNARLALLFMVSLVTAAGNTALQSILPALGTRLGLADIWVSLAYSWSALLWVITAPLWARQSDKRGRKLLMAIGLLGFTLAMLFCGITLAIGLTGVMTGAVTFALFALFRSFYGGFGSAAAPAVQAYIAARSAPAERTKLLSLIASSVGLGTIIGPTVAPYFIGPPYGLANPLFAFAVIGALVIVALRIMLPDDAPRFEARGQISPYPSAGGAPDLPLEEEPDHRENDAPVPPAPAERIGWFDPRIRGWTLAALVTGNAQAMLMGVIGFLILDRLDLRSHPELAAAPTGHVLWVGATATLLAQWGLIPLLSLSPRSNVILGAILSGLGVFLLGLAESLTSMSTCIAIAMLGFGLARPGFTAGASLAVPRAYQGQIAGQSAALSGMAYIASPAIGVLLYNWKPELIFDLVAFLLVGLALWAQRRLRDTDTGGGVQKAA